MNHFFIFIIFLLSFSTHATFFKPHELKVAPKNLTKIINSIGNLKSAWTGDSCSAVVISSAGHVLTNMHCIKACMKEHSFFSTSTSTQEFSSVLPTIEGEFFQLYTPKNSIPNFTCQDLGLDFRSSNGTYVGTPKLVALGSGLGFAATTKLDQMKQRDFDFFKKNNNDYVLLKFDEQEKFPCVKTGIRKKEKVTFLVGHPRETFLPSGHHNSNGRDMYITVGQERASIVEDPMIRRLNLSPLGIKRVKELSSQRRYRIFSHHSVSGMSGGGIFNKNGEFIALHFGSYGDFSKSPFIATSVSVSVDSIKNDLKRKYGSRFAKEAFNCEE